MSNSKLAARSLFLGQLSFFIAITVCFFVLPSGRDNTDGLSYFGVHRASLVPYTVGFMAASWFCAQAAAALESGSRAVTRTLRLIALLLLGVLITPYDYGNTTGVLHEAFGTTLFFSELAFIAFLWTERQTTRLDAALFVLLFAGGWLSMLSLPSIHILHMEVLAQLLYQLIFSIAAIQLVQAPQRSRRTTTK